MPEGDTIFILARNLRPDLVQRTLDQVDLREKAGGQRLQGARVLGVEARGKHLLLHTDRGLTLRVHLGIGGSWHRYRPGERWRKSRDRARLTLTAGGLVQVAFDAPQVEVFRTADLARHPKLSALGPDLLAPPVDHDRVLARARDPARAGEPVGEVLIDQRVAAGLGNVFKSELAFLEGIHPFTPVAEVPDAALAHMFREGERLLRVSVDVGRRITTVGPAGARPRSRGARYWVYHRAGKPCFRCGTPIRQRQQGDLARLTYWCPTCQPR